MKKFLILSLLVFAMTFYSVDTKAQFNPYAEGVTMISAGLGVSGWGVPIYGRVEFPVADNVTVGGGLSWQSYGYSSYWNSNYFGIQGRGSYHFNELWDFNDDWDLYAGANLTYFISSYTYDGPGTATWDGGGPDGIGFGIHVGGRYFVNDNFALNAELGGASYYGGAMFGVTFLL